MDLKVRKEHEDEWSILSGDKIVGRIEYSRSYVGRSGSKILYVKDKNVAYVKNQTEALEKLDEFFVKIKEDIKNVETAIDELKIGLTQVSHQACIYALNLEIDRLGKVLEGFKSYDLI